jgi:hypothetical protein
MFLFRHLPHTFPVHNFRKLVDWHHSLLSLLGSLHMFQLQDQSNQDSVNMLCQYFQEEDNIQWHTWYIRYHWYL